MWGVAALLIARDIPILKQAKARYASLQQATDYPLIGKSRLAVTGQVGSSTSLSGNPADGPEVRIWEVGPGPLLGRTLDADPGFIEIGIGFGGLAAGWAIAPPGLCVCAAGSKLQPR